MALNIRLPSAASVASAAPVAMGGGLAAASLILLVLVWRRRERPLIQTVPALITLQVFTWLSAGCSTAIDERRSAETIGLRKYFHQGLDPGPTVITSSTGQVLDDRRFEPFGHPINVNPTVDPHNSLNKETDAATQWSYHGSRWMMPQTARWTVPDPPARAPDPKFMAAPWQLHPYQYAEQNPTVFWDPEGEDNSSGQSLLELSNPEKYADLQVEDEMKSWRKARNNFRDGAQPGSPYPSNQPGSDSNRDPDSIFGLPELRNPLGELVVIERLRAKGLLDGGRYEVKDDPGLAIALLFAGPAGRAGSLEGALARGAIEGGVAAEASLGVRFLRLFYDNRPFGQISREYWALRGGWKGRDLSHIFFSRSWKAIPQGFRNAGLNLVELPGLVGVFHRSLSLNRWMGLAPYWRGSRHFWTRIAARSMDWGIRVGGVGAVGGTAYGGYKLGTELSEWYAGE
jgi:RHS repeat-associated protein